MSGAVRTGTACANRPAIVHADGEVQNSYTYDIYGEPTVTSSLANEFDFAGQQTDGSTGLQYLRARYYDPAAGVFLSREPLERLPGWMGNPFGYAGANPARYLDPTGLVLVDSSDGCGQGSCLDTNDIIPHNGGAFREYQGRTQWCESWTRCRDASPEEFAETSCDFVVGWTAVVCRNKFGGVIATIHVTNDSIGKRLVDANGDGDVSTLEKVQFLAKIVSILTPFHDSTGPIQPPQPCPGEGLDFGAGCQKPR